ncbi:hypothetical protein [Marmoricola sp. RAF53]
MSAPDYRQLPEPVRLEDTIAAVDVRAVPDIEAGQNVDQRMALQYAAG